MPPAKRRAIPSVLLACFISPCKILGTAWHHPISDCMSGGRVRETWSMDRFSSVDSTVAGQGRGASIAGHYPTHIASKARERGRGEGELGIS